MYLYPRQTTEEANKYNLYLLLQHNFHSPKYETSSACQGLCRLQSSSRNKTERDSLITKHSRAAKAGIREIITAKGDESSGGGVGGAQTVKDKPQSLMEFTTRSEVDRQAKTC